MRWVPFSWYTGHPPACPSEGRERNHRPAAYHKRMGARDWPFGYGTGWHSCAHSALVTRRLVNAPSVSIRRHLMNSQRGLSKSTYFWFFLLIASAVLLQSFQGTQANSTAVTATYSQGALHVKIPYAAGHVGTGTLAVEVLDPEDRVVGRTERAAIANDGTGTWRADIQLPNAL